MNDVEIKPVNSFESIKRIDPSGGEYWSGRDMAKTLQYNDWRNFAAVIQKAIKSCQTAGITTENHFDETTEMVQVGSGAIREVDNYYLSRYACYLIIQNADPTKDVVAAGQTYFAVQTRKQEIAEDQLSQMDEDQKRLMLREEMKVHNKNLASAAKNAGVIRPLDYAIFQDHGYRGLYGGLGMKDIHSHKGLKKSQQILDHMGSTELAANLFRATQTEEKLRRDKITHKTAANKAHLEVGQKVRQTIMELGGTMPEQLPVAECIKKVGRKAQKAIKESSES